jgi:hypothetical protein
MGALVRSGRHDRRGMGYVVMTFDPTRPCQRRKGTKIVQIVQLERPIAASGDTLFALDESGDGTTHRADGRFSSGQSPLDLVNIPEEVTVELWGIVQDGRDKARAVFASENVAEHYRQPSEVVVRMTGSYTR